MRITTFKEALTNVEHLRALGWTDIHLERNGEHPWAFATKVESGGCYRLSGPADAKITAEHPSGLTFTWYVDFEGRDANGRGVSLFDRDGLRDVMRKLPKSARGQFAKLLKSEVLEGMAKRTAEIREALNAQQDSEDLVRGLIAFAESE